MFKHLIQLLLANVELRNTRNLGAHRNNLPHLRTNEWIFFHIMAEEKLEIMFQKVSPSMRKVAEKKYKETN